MFCAFHFPLRRFHPLFVHHVRFPTLFNIDESTASASFDPFEAFCIFTERVSEYAVPAMVFVVGVTHRDVKSPKERTSKTYAFVKFKER
jgi:hypothetical protein